MVMAKFKFRLARVAKIKAALEEQAQNKWAAANKIVQIEQEVLLNLNHTKEDARDFGYRELGLEHFSNLHCYLDSMDRKIEEQQEQVNLCIEAEQIARQEWMQVRQEKEILERLREKQYEKYLYEEARAEQNRLDELKNTSSHL